MASAYPNPFSKVWMDAAIEQRPTRPMIQQNYVGLNYFPLQRVYDYELTWDLIRSSNHLAGLYAHDGRPIPGNDPTYSSLAADIMHIMGTRTISPNLVFRVRDAGELAVRNSLTQSIQQKLMAKVAEKLAYCQDEAEATMEYLCLRALQGSIPWPPTTEAGVAIANPPASWGDIGFTLSMGFRSNFIQNASTLTGVTSGLSAAGFAWSDHTNSNPILDLEVIAEDYNETTGMDMYGATVLCSRAVISHMMQNTNVLLWLRGTAGPAAESRQSFINQSVLRNALESILGYKFVPYDAQWTYTTGLATPSEAETRIRFLPKGKMIFIAPGALDGGLAFFATAPDLGAEDGEKLGLYSWFYKEPFPPNRSELGVGIHGFPVLKSSEEIYVLDALA